jgi:imidazolonepropionase-like amidohydrolase
VAGGRVIDAAGRFFDNRASAHGDLPDDATGVLCRTVEDFIIQTRRQCARGVNMIKIADSRWGDEQTMSREAIAAVVEEAHRHGVKVAIHSRGSGSTRDSALAGACRKSTRTVSMMVIVHHHASSRKPGTGIQLAGKGFGYACTREHDKKREAKALAPHRCDNDGAGAEA